jgi:NAD+ kinase
MEIRSVGICAKPSQPQLADFIRELEKGLVERGREALLDTEAAQWTRSPGFPRRELAEKVDLVAVLGGDGTLLAVARALGDRSVPILGVNLGTMGFMAETARDELFPALDAIFAGRFRSEARMRLDVTVEHDGTQLGRYVALNDAVIARTALSRMIDLETHADGMEVTTYHADGLIVATPTGSSAYSLSAGGPLVLPTIEAIMLTPICSHTLTQRPLVLPPHCEIGIRVQDTRGGEVHVTVDGQVGCQLRDDDCVRVCRSPHPVQLLVPPDCNRFEVMRTKLGWGAR